MNNIILTGELDLDEYRWNCVIPAHNVSKAIALMEYFIDTKFSLLPICESYEETRFQDCIVKQRTDTYMCNMRYNASQTQSGENIQK